MNVLNFAQLISYGSGSQSMIITYDVFVTFYSLITGCMFTYTCMYIAFKLVYCAKCIQLYFFRTERDLPDLLITDRLHIKRNMAQAPVPKKKKEKEQRYV